MITHLDFYFQKASLEIKRKMLGSIFPGKLTFENGKYRINGMNLALAIILQKTKGLQNEKIGEVPNLRNVSGELPNTVAISNQFIKGMRQIYELQPFVDVRLIRLGETAESVREELLALTGT